MTNTKPTELEMKDPSKWVKGRNPEKPGLYAVISPGWGIACWLYYGGGNWSHGGYFTNDNATETALANFERRNFLSSATVLGISWFDKEPGLFD